MFGLDNKSGINAMPPIAPADSQTPKWFTEGGAGLSATYPGQDWFNQIQAELLNVLKAAGIAPQKDNLSQLSSAISKLASTYAVSIVHSTGQSLTSVISQNASTQLFAEKKNFFSSSNQAGVRPSEGSDISFVTLSTGHVGVWSNTAGEFLWHFTGSKMMKGEVPLSLVTGFRESFVGMTAYFMHRSAQLPAGWYSINGDRYSVSSPQGVVIKSLPAQLKADWRITESGGMINLPDPRFTDGRMPFPRPVNGTNRQVGTIEDDTARRITGSVNGIQFKFGAAPTGAFTASAMPNQGTVLQDGSSTVMRIDFDSGRVVTAGTEGKPLDIGVTWAIYLGV